MMSNDLPRRTVAEAIGTAMLLAAVVGSGVMGERLSGSNLFLTLMANALATGCALVALILTFVGISGAHFNPIVSLSAALRRTLPWRELPNYLAAQVAGAFAGIAIAHAMFGLPLFSVSNHARTGLALGLGEFVAAFGLVAVIEGSARLGSRSVALAVAAYITAAYWFTSSTSFANPAVTLARSLSNTFVGIRPLDAPGFILAQLAGGFAATMLFRWLIPEKVVDENQ
jgi:glycerol uptake facilitator-like aquaporin